MLGESFSVRWNSERADPAQVRRSYKVFAQVTEEGKLPPPALAT
jgi:hypothetical protein